MKEKPTKLSATLQLNLPGENFRADVQSQDDIVESFSRGFEADLKGILGDSYHARPMDEGRDAPIKGRGLTSRGSERKSSE